MVTRTNQRILIALDAHETSEESLTVVVTMAERLHASLAGLFVEDSRLTSLANLPLCIEINRVSAQERHLCSDAVIQLNQSVSARIQNLLKELSAHHRVSCSFRTEAGELVPLALMQEGVDVFFPARQRTVPQPGHLRSRRADQLKLTLVYEQSSQFDRAMAIVWQLAGNDLRIEVTLLCEDELPNNPAALIPSGNVSIIIRRVSSLAAAVRQALCQSDTSLVLLPKHHMSLEELSRIFYRLATPLLLLD